jgi:hypothetical protein
VTNAAAVKGAKTVDPSTPAAEGLVEAGSSRLRSESVASTTEPGHIAVSELEWLGY